MYLMTDHFVQIHEMVSLGQVCFPYCYYMFSIE